MALYTHTHTIHLLSNKNVQGKTEIVNNTNNMINTTNIKQNNGITLIALITTIIVLLILAGVSIAMLTGRNGILTQAQKAKQETDTKTTEEKVQLAIMVARTQSEIGEIDVNKLIEEVTKNYGGTVTTTDGKLPAYIAIDGKSFTITNKGILKNVEVLNSSTEENIHDEKIDLTWEELKQISKAIEKANISEETVSVTVKVDGKIKKLTLGNYKVVQYSGTNKKVRIIGFNHDIKSNGDKAGITFDFVTSLATAPMKVDGNTTGGWGATEMKNNMETYLEKLEGDGVPLSNYIVEVKKSYIKVYNDANSVQTDNTDKLWLLAASEIFAKNSEADTRYAIAITSEGNQYKYYKIVTNGIAYDASNPKLEKYTTYNVSDNSNSSVCWWWLRSPNYVYIYHFCNIGNSDNSSGNNSNNASNFEGSVAPGFSI